MLDPIPGFSHHTAEVNGQTIAYSEAGQGEPVLLLHGFPQNRAMWRDVAPGLARTHHVIAADLRGYGDSGDPGGGMAGMTFRNMAADQAALMAHLGHERFHLVGHDRGARTGHRLALDHPERLLSLTLMDIVPTEFLVRNITSDAATAYFHWFYLIQPSPFPETMIQADPDYFFEQCLSGFGAVSLSDFHPEAMETYRHHWRKPETIAAMCNDYRAALALDVQDDCEDLNRQVPCQSLVLYGEHGVMAKYYDVPGSWSARLTSMQSQSIPGGHFFIEQSPEETLAAVSAFLGSL
ncbi:MAG: alpha/beta hydrolase [Pseudomonadota bacterium]